VRLFIKKGRAAIGKGKPEWLKGRKFKKRTGIEADAKDSVHNLPRRRKEKGFKSGSPKGKEQGCKRGGGGVPGEKLLMA